MTDTGARSLGPEVKQKKRLDRLSEDLSRNNEQLRSLLNALEGFVTRINGQATPPEATQTSDVVQEPNGALEFFDERLVMQTRTISELQELVVTLEKIA